MSFTSGWGKEQFCFFQTADTGERAPISSVESSGANHYPKTPAQYRYRTNIHYLWTTHVPYSIRTYTVVKSIIKKHILTKETFLIYIMHL